MDNLLEATNASIKSEIEWINLLQQLIRLGLEKEDDPFVVLAELLAATEYMKALLKDVLAK